MTVTFREEDHSYWHEGKRLVSVTQVLKPLYDFSSVCSDVLARAAAFGTAVHKTVELYLKDDLDEDSLDDGLKGPLEAFKKWQIDCPMFSDTQPTIEIAMFHKRLKYAGMADLRYPNAVIDLKSRPANHFIDPLQLVAYDRMDGEREFHYVLELKQDGTYVFTRMSATKKERNENWSRFRYLLDYHKMTNEIQKWRK